MYKKGHFQRSEFACECGCGFDTMDSELLEVLEDIRKHFGKPIQITSGNRCANHNKKIGGAPHSFHIKGIACDFKVIGISNQDEVADYLENKYPDCYGIGRYIGRTHIDVREEKVRWDYRNH